MSDSVLMCEAPPRIPSQVDLRVRGLETLVTRRQADLLGTRPYQL